MSPSCFDDHVDSYGEAVESSIAFAGAPHELYTRIKANLLVALAARFLSDPTGLGVLDVGCGPGETDSFLEGRFAHLTGVDVAEGMVNEASRRNPWAEYASYAAGGPLPFDDDSFDLAFTICVLHHVPPAKWEAFVAELARVTRPGGVVAIFEHNPWNPLTRRAVRGCEFDAGVTLASRGRVRRLLAGRGLEVLAARHIIFFPREGRTLRGIERALAQVPLGAQHYVAARKGA